MGRCCEKMKIKPVKNNIQKGKTYAQLISKYNSAMGNGFYGEAEIIVYAFIEDRLKSFIYHIDGLNTYNSLNINENLARVCGGQLSIKQVSDKITVINKSISVAKMHKENKADTYVQMLGMIYKYIDTTELSKKMTDIQNWCNYRNEIVHALFNKDLAELRLGFEKHVREGFRLARYIDSQVEIIQSV